nr:ulp1 protease family, C-terminal catalytic domain-containing protein [Tanacetum cinerariifolium]
MNCKICTRTTPTALFNAMAILNDDRKKCLHEMGFASMIGMGIYELPGKLGYYVIDNFDSETNVLSLNDSSILVTLESVNDILGIPMGGCSIESLEPRTANDHFIKEWLSQFGEKTEIRPNDISEVIVSTKDAGKLFKMNFLMLFANTMGLCETS